MPTRDFKSSKCRATVVLLTYNSLEETTRPCIDSLYKYTPVSDFQLVIVDNMSTDGTREYLENLEKSHANITLHLNKKNEGYAAGNNRGIELAEYPYIVLLNNDTLVTPDWLQTILRPLDEDPSVGLVGPVSNSCGNEQCVKLANLTEKNYVEVSKKHCAKLAGHEFDTDRLSFFCVGMSTDFLSSVGLLDENFGIGMFEDDDLCFRAKKKHWKITVVEDCFIFHKGSASFKKLEEKTYQDLFNANRHYFGVKHGQLWFFSGIAIAIWKKLTFDFMSLKQIDESTLTTKIEVRTKGMLDSLYQISEIEWRDMKKIDGLTLEVQELNNQLQQTQIKLLEEQAKNNESRLELDNCKSELRVALEKNYYQTEDIKNLSIVLNKIKAYRVHVIIFGLIKILKKIKRFFSYLRILR